MGAPLCSRASFRSNEAAIFSSKAEPYFSRRCRSASLRSTFLIFCLRFSSACSRSLRACDSVFHILSEADRWAISRTVTVRKETGNGDRPFVFVGGYSSFNSTVSGLVPVAGQFPSPLSGRYANALSFARRRSKFRQTSTKDWPQRPTVPQWERHHIPLLS